MRPVPNIAMRPPQRGVAIATRCARRELPAIVPRLFGEVLDWLTSRGEPAGAPFVRYRVVDYNTGEVEIEVGVPAAVPAPVSDRVRETHLPGGRYAAVVHHGGYDGLPDTTAALLGWAEREGVRWRVEDDGAVTRWAGRVEHYLVGPPAEADPRRWRTEVAILTAEESPDAESSAAADQAP